MNASGDLLYQCVQEKVRVLTDLTRFGQEQVTMINQGNSLSLLGLLSDKQRLIDALGEIQSRMAPLLETPPDRRQWSSAGLRQKCLQATERCNALGQKLLQLEQECEQKAVKQQTLLAKQIKEFSFFDSSSMQIHDPSEETHLASFDESS